ncbi:hypothetical protein GW17_00000406 [Ensete ventricosum]|nr:hypothetical protein GW17_00000406 [Ensete ventricosum]
MIHSVLVGGFPRWKTETFFIPTTWLHREAVTGFSFPVAFQKPDPAAWFRRLRFGFLASLRPKKYFTSSHPRPPAASVSRCGEPAGEVVRGERFNPCMVKPGWRAELSSLLSRLLVAFSDGVRNPAQLVCAAGVSARSLQCLNQRNEKGC